VDYSANKPSEYRTKWRRRQEQLNDLLLALLPEVSDIRFTLGTGTYPAARVDFKTPYGWVPLRQLGYGYQTLIAWVVDFASRMVERYPDSPDPLAEPAVALVDEIDLHLHPVWQRKLIGDLTERFPNTQFIATAHSPLVVQAAGDANIAVLRREGDHVVIDNERGAVRGWRVDQILTSDLYDLPTAWPPEFDGLLRRRKELLTKPKRTAAENRELAKLQKQIRSLPLGESAEQVETMNLLRETLEVLQQKVPPKS
jgi:predicted ATP-binding protein involved in virulence